MELTHKILDGVDVRDLCGVAASIILLENDFFFIKSIPDLTVEI